MPVLDALKEGDQAGGVCSSVHSTLVGIVAADGQTLMVRCSRRQPTDHGSAVVAVVVVVAVAVVRDAVQLLAQRAVSTVVDRGVILGAPAFEAVEVADVDCWTDCCRTGEGRKDEMGEANGRSARTARTARSPARRTRSHRTDHRNRMRGDVVAVGSAVRRRD